MALSRLSNAPKINWTGWRRTMMRRLISLLLIPLVVVSQSVSMLAHDHAGQGASTPSEHASRPHFHTHAGNGHHHHHIHRLDVAHDLQDTTRFLISAADPHESDAIYVSTSTPFLIQRQSGAECATWLQQPTVCMSVMSALDLVEMPYSHCSGFFSQTRCAHALVAFETLSLRI